MCVTKYACQLIQKSISTTTKETAIVEDKVATAEGSMTNRIMFTKVMGTGEKRMNTQPHQSSQNSNGQKTEGQYMTGKNMEIHKSHDVTTKLVSNDNTGVQDPKGERCPSAQV
jgi:hypothetical protein